jgi:flagellum-specific ATP synthase
MHDLQRIDPILHFGRVQSLIGPLLEVISPTQQAVIGTQCHIHTTNQRKIPGEVIGFRNNLYLVMPFENIVGVGPGSRVDFTATAAVIYPHHSWLGRVLNARAIPIDDDRPLVYGHAAYSLKASPPAATTRRLVEKRLDMGVRAINTFLTCCQGQRMGIFSASGIGKSILLSQLARFTQADMIIIGLIGERGREVREFIDKHLGAEGLRKSIVIAATSDESALMRRQAAYLTLTLAEYFRDQGAEVLCLIDSVTRFAMALREIGLAAGEPPASKGYTPSVFAELPRLLERAGPGQHHTSQGDITGIFTVLVEGNDLDEPIADAVRGILDGHIILNRAIAERGRFPPIDILRSLSRTVPDCHSQTEHALVMRARRLLATYEDMAEMIRLGAYRKGSNPAVDEAMDYYDSLEAFLAQGQYESATLEDSFMALASVLHKEDLQSTESINHGAY